MSKIIVGVDESDHSKDAVALAARLARGSKAELMFVCAYPYDRIPSRATNAAYEHALRDDTLAILDRAAGLVESQEVETQAIPDTSPARAIQELAAREHASLIVIGSSHRSSAGRVLAGTTAERLLHGAPCPVAVAPAGYHAGTLDSIATIAVGYDGSDEAEAALTAATVLARALRARLRVIDVVDITWVGTPALMWGAGIAKPPDDLEERTLSRLADRLSELPGDVAAQPQVLAGDPEPVLVEQSELADLFVVGSRGYGPHRAVLLGSVSGRLTRDAACPVLVVPRGVEAPLEGLFPVASETQPA